MLWGPPWFVESSCRPRHIKGAGPTDATITSSAAVAARPVAVCRGEELETRSSGSGGRSVVSVGGPGALRLSKAWGCPNWVSEDCFLPQLLQTGRWDGGPGMGTRIRVPLAYRFFRLAPREGVGRTQDLTAEWGLCPTTCLEAPSSVSQPLPCGVAPTRRALIPVWEGSGGRGPLLLPPFLVPLRSTPWPFFPHFAVVLLNSKLLRFLGKYIIVPRKIIVGKRN